MRLFPLVKLTDPVFYCDQMTDSDIMIDAADKRILALLQKNNRLSYEEIGARVSLSPSAARRRIKRLRDRKIIEADVSIISPLVNGVEVIVSVTMMEESTTSYDGFRKRIIKSEAVSQCYSVTGAADFILHVHTADLSSFEQWINDNILADTSVRRCLSNVVYSRIKFETARKV